MAPASETPFRRALRLRREPFRAEATVASLALAVAALLLGILLPVLCYVLARHVIATFGIAWSPLGRPRDSNSTIFRLAGLLGYAAAALAILRMLPRLGRASLRDLGLRPLRRTDLGMLALLISANAAIVLVLPFYYRALHATNHVQAGFEHFAIRTPLEAILTASSMIFIGPLAEELFFRAVVFNALARRIGAVAAAAASGLLFGLLHGDLILLPFLTLQGALWALAYRRTGNLWVAILAHGLNNFAAFLYLFL